MKKILFLIFTLISIFSLSSCNNVSLIDENIDNQITLTKRNKISSNGNSLIVSATLSPTWINDTLSWTAEWATSYAYSVSQYYTITPSSDTLSCIVKLKYNIGHKVILTCTSNSNSSLKASCTIDNVSRRFDNGYIGDISIYSSDYWEDVAFNIVDNISSYKTELGSYYGTLIGEVRNFEIIIEDEWETENGWCFYPYENTIVSETEYCPQCFVDSEFIYVPVNYDVYYNGAFICSYNTRIEVMFTYFE